MSKIKIILSFLYLTVLVTSSHATTWDRSYVENFVKTYVKENFPSKGTGKTEITVNPIDPRVKIKPCNSPLTANIPENHTGRNVNVKVSCEDPIRWQLYIPVKIRSTIPVVIAKVDIAKGSLFNESNMEVVFKDTQRVRGEIISSIDLAEGNKAKRRVSKNSTITRRNMCVVCKGDAVTIVARSDTFLIKTAGIALSAGNMGDHINVKNKRSGKTITAQVKTINKVVINL